MKYTQEQLTAMAKSYFWHKEHAPMVCNQFLQIMSALTDLHPKNVETRIKMMAGGNFSFENN